MAKEYSEVVTIYVNGMIVTPLEITCIAGTPTMNSVLNASMEAIDFQRNSMLLKEMSLQIESGLKDPSKATFNAISASLQKIAKKHTGMTFNIHFSKMGGPNAFVFPPQANSANPMASNEIAASVRRVGMGSEKEIFKGEVDLKTGKVSGLYANIPIDIFCAVEFFTARGAHFRGEHIAAVICHEMGHAFTYLRYLGKLVISNCVVAEIVKKQHEGESDKVIQELVKVAEQKTGWRMKDTGEINGSTDPILIQQIVMSAAIGSIRSELNTRFYDRRAFEFSSDQFVARHGGAQYIVEALDIMYRQYPMYLREYRGRVGNYVTSLLGYGKLALGAIALIAGGGVTSPVLAIFAGTFCVLMSLFAGGDDGVYDPIPKRYEAMRRELIASSKDQNLTVKQRQGLIEQIQAIDDILESLTDKHYFGPELIGEWLAGIFTGRPAEQKFQRQLENLVNNRLFELSNKLQAQA